MAFIINGQGSNGDSGEDLPMPEEHTSIKFKNIIIAFLHFRYIMNLIIYKHHIESRYLITVCMFYQLVLRALLN